MKDEAIREIDGKEGIEGATKNIKEKVVLEIDCGTPKPKDITPAQDLREEGGVDLADIETDQKGPSSMEGGKGTKDEWTVAVDGLKDIIAKDIIRTQETSWIALNVVGGGLIAKASVVPRRCGGKEHVRHDAREIEDAKVPVKDVGLAVHLDQIDEEEEGQ